jgi:UDP-N-acetylmuramate-alanine ligase
MPMAVGTDIFIAEADESDRSFLVFRPHFAVVTNVEHDHPEEFVDLRRRWPRRPSETSSTGGRWRRQH